LGFGGRPSFTSPGTKTDVIFYTGRDLLADRQIHRFRPDRRAILAQQRDFDDIVTGISRVFEPERQKMQLLWPRTRQENLIKVRNAH